MEPVTHVLTGACLSRAGLNRRAAYATLAMAVAAEFPDIDTLWSVRGPIAGFQHHRGITHTLIGIPVEAALLLLLTMGLHRVRLSRQPHAARTASLTQAPVRWPLLYGGILLALASHLLLDYTNNYGLRPFFPFLDRWYAASIVFIFDPLIFLLLVAALLLPALFGLVAREVGSGRKEFASTAWPRAALLCILALWTWRAIEHAAAMSLAQSQSLQAPAAPVPADLPALLQNPSSPEGDVVEPHRPMLPAQRSMASPDPFSPFRWYIATDFGPAYRLNTANTRTGVLYPGQVLTKPDDSAVLDAARRSHLGTVYLDWSAMPWLAVRDADSSEDPALPGARSLVTFQDLRFMGGLTLLNRHGKMPLTGEVVLGPDGQMLAEGMDGKLGR